jgi:hypothetical protein
MAYLFPDPGTTFCLLEKTGLTLANYPITLNCWFRTGTTLQSKQFVTVSTASNNYMRIGINASNQVVATAANTTARSATAGTFTTNTWTMATGVFTSNTSRTAYKDAVSGSANTATATTSSPTVFTVGGNNGSPNCYDATLAEVAMWDVALTAAEITSLYRGVLSTKIRPQNLLVYMPLVRCPTGTAGTNNHINLVGTAISDSASSDTNPTVADHVRIYQ